MHIKIILSIFSLTLLLTSCAKQGNDWFSEYGQLEAQAPNTLQYGTFEYATATPNNINSSDAKRVAVLLPLSGANAHIGREIRTGIEIATLQRGPQNFAVSFYDTASQNSNAIQSALAGNPALVIGPLFASDARSIRIAKPETLPVLSFTSDATALGNGVLSMSLMPTNSIEVIVQEMRNDKIKSFIIIAPDTESGRLMAGAARMTATNQDLPVTGVFYYTEGNTDSIKNTTLNASMNSARVSANNRAREILSDILTKELLSDEERISLTTQLESLSKTDTLGALPYNAVLFLGSGNDTKSLASFLRYYGVNNRDVRFYGTAFWDNTNLTSDLTMSGAKFATLPPTNVVFSDMYEHVSGTTPSRLATFGFDATNLAIGMLYSGNPQPAYLLNPSGYIGSDGIFRLKPTGESERALQVMELNGSGTARKIKSAPTNFIKPIYVLEQHKIRPAGAMDLETPGINPNKHIQIPERLQRKYKSKTYGTHISTPVSTTAQSNDSIVILPEDDREIISDPEYQPVRLETVGRTYIEEIEVEE